MLNISFKSVTSKIGCVVKDATLIMTHILLTSTSSIFTSFKCLLLDAKTENVLTEGRRTPDLEKLNGRGTV
jgi:hypothetical protein